MLPLKYEEHTEIIHFFFLRRVTGGKREWRNVSTRRLLNHLNLSGGEKKFQKVTSAGNSIKGEKVGKVLLNSFLAN